MSSSRFSRPFPCALTTMFLLLLAANVWPGARAADPVSPPAGGTDRPLAAAADPSAVYCTILGYGYETVSTERGEEGICVLPDGRRVNAWEFFRGKVAPEFSYCGRRGYRTEVVDLGNGSFTAECAVCVDDHGAVIGTAGELSGANRAAGLEGPAMPGPGQARPPETGPARSGRPTPPSSGLTRPRASRERPLRDLPPAFDWRALGGCTPIKNQGGCGSCWAFSTVAPLECGILIKDGVVEDLSEQWLVSCNQDGWSCGGGWYAHKYFISAVDPCDGTRAVMEGDFPYAAEDLPCDCPYPHTARYVPSSWDFVDGQGVVSAVDSIKQAILEYGPVSVAISASGRFGGYHGGVYDDCGQDNLNHAVALVGWDDNQGPEGVWFLRNSWGTWWGEDGYMRIPYNCSLVGFEAISLDYPGMTVITLSFPDRLTSAPDGNGTVYFSGSITNVSDADDVITLSVSEAGGWQADLQIEGDPSFYQSHPEPLAPGESKGITVRVRTDGVKRLGTGVLSALSGNTNRAVEVEFRVFNACPSLLLVDDDNGASYEGPFVQGLEELGYPHETIEGGPDAEDLRGYDAVIWQTGYIVSPLRQEGMDALTAYLDAGGKLFLSSMDLLTGITPPNPFVTDYLGVESWTVNTRASRAVGVPGDPITDGMDLSLEWPTSFANRVDTVNPHTGASIIFQSEAGRPAAVRYDSGTFRTVFSTVVQNAMPADGQDPNNSRAVLHRVLNWLVPPGSSAVEPPSEAPSQPSPPALWAGPNPARGRAEIVFTVGPDAGRVRLSVVNAGGRVVRQLAGEAMAAGRHRISWDCRDDSGHPAPTGCYFARLEIGEGVATSRILVVH